MTKNLECPRCHKIHFFVYSDLTAECVACGAGVALLEKDDAL